MSKQPRIKDIKDGGEFRLSKKSNVYYSLQTIKKGKAVITSESSGRTFTVSANLKVFVD